MKKIFDDIYIGSNIISILNDYTKDFDKILIFSNETIADLYFEKFKSTLNEKDKIFYFAIKDGEEYKNIESILPVYDFMLENNFSRKSLIISLGGGVICDMGGYISATYMRGIEFIQVPTSLLAQVDASVGGKVAINHPKCKNMIGSFKNPYRVIIDVEFLKTLPKREFKSGMGELLKHSFLTKDKSYLEYIENNVEKIKNLDNKVLENISRRENLEIKDSPIIPDSYKVMVKINKGYDKDGNISYKILEAYLNILKDYYNENVFKYINNRKKYLEGAIPILKKELTDNTITTKVIITDMMNNENNYLKYFFPIKVSNIDSYYPEYVKLESEYQSIKTLFDLELNEPKNFIKYDSSIIVEKEKSDNIIKLGIGIFLSLCLGVLATFIKEFIEGYKKNKEIL